MCEYSANEKKLFAMFGFNPEMFDPLPLYKMCADKAFICNMQGPHIEALRRSYRALILCLVYRLTPEFELLLEF